MNDELTVTDAEPIRVAAAVTELEIPTCSEVMCALPDPADPDQAILVNVPVLVDEVNFGDIVGLGEADECGVRPIVGVVMASGHVHMLAATQDGGAKGLAAELERMFPAYALRMALASETILSVSVHPDVDPDRVTEVIEAWLDAGAEDPDEGPAVGPECESLVGWPL